MAACITVTRTVKFQVRPAANAGKHDALPATVRGWDRAVGFHTDFFLEHPGIFSEQKPYIVRRGKHAGEERRRPERHDEPRRPNRSEPPLDGGRAALGFLMLGHGRIC